MDSQLEDVTCFTSFLQQGVEVPIASSQFDEQSFMGSDFQESASNKKRGCNFTTGEDNLLVSSCLNNSLDAVEWKNPDWQQPRIESLHKSGISKEDNIQDARKINENDNERPIGRKAAKERKRLSQSLFADGSSLSSAILELKDEKKKAHIEKMMSKALSIQSATDQRDALLDIQKAQLAKAKEGNHIKSEKLKFLQSKEEMEIMMKDTSSMTPEQKEYFQMRRMKILRRNNELS
ncbi:hypothetical protein LIER_19088 [Lithospermum erythrorhizon]|uniref:No apical meristem-associated C-terminal domain-containing protein n=1 Tax=Lithospermum erythrorhizon TaxID=34254 RepID=A0AAV3QJJ2_LITER